MKGIGAEAGTKNVVYTTIQKKRGAAGEISGGSGNAFPAGYDGARLNALAPAADRNALLAASSHDGSSALPAALHTASHAGAKNDFGTAFGSSSANTPSVSANESKIAAVRVAAYLFTKRVLDFTLSFIGLSVLMPLLFVVAVVVWIDSPGAIFHRRRVLERQDYAGGSPRTFDAFKIRTMLPNADEILRANPDLFREYQKDFKLKEDPRVTRVGKKLRTTSLDELPQLLNVLRGQMSLVGPRMITPPELEMYRENAAELLTVKPGLTGLWQVSGRQHISYDQRVRLDMWYIENRSLRLDLEILIRTVGCVLQREGAF